MTAAQPPPATAEQETVFWQSIMNSTNPAEFEAYLSQFPNGVFRALAKARLAALRAAAGAATGAGTGVAGTGSPVTGAVGASAPVFGFASAGDAPRRPGDVFRNCVECPEMVVVPGGGLAMGRYEVTVGEYRAFVSATGGTGDDRWRDHDWFWVSADGPASGGVCELGRRAGVCVVAEPEDGVGVSVADGGGVGAGGGRVSARMLRRPHGQAWRNVPGGVVRLERGRSVGHGRERAGVDVGLLGG